LPFATAERRNSSKTAPAASASFPKKNSAHHRRRGKRNPPQVSAATAKRPFTDPLGAALSLRATQINDLRDRRPRRLAETDLRQPHCSRKIPNNVDAIETAVKKMASRFLAPRRFPKACASFSPSSS